MPVPPRSAPIIVSALFCDADLAWLDRQRRAHYPPERNQLSAHLTLFQHLPPSCGAELAGRLRAETLVAAPPARIAAPVSLGRGVAYRIDSPALEAIRANLAEWFAPMLGVQDRAPWWPHVTIQNKVEPRVAKTVLTMLATGFAPQPLGIAGLAMWHYRGGPWEPVAAFRFGGGRSMKLPSSRPAG